MSFNRNENLKIVGFFGQSGSGKTTIIRNVERRINNNVILQNTGIIRYLFKKNNYYLNPEQLVNDYKVELDTLEESKKNFKIDEIYDRYIHSQLQLLNDWSTEVYLTTAESYSSPCILLVDRSPIDFYVLTLCGIKYLKSVYNRNLNENHKYFVSLIKQVAEDNTNNFLNAIFVTKPWETSNINDLKDGIRDQYLSEFYVGDAWYPRYKDVKLKETKTFFIDADITDLQERAKLVAKKLEEL